jgi:hypothetical protein
MTITIDSSLGWMPEKDRLDTQQQGVLDILVGWARDSSEHHNTHWLKGFAGSGKTILLIYAMIQTMGILRDQAPGSKVCFLTYTYALKDLALSALNMDGQDDMPIFTFDEYMEAPKTPDILNFVFVDEIQDIKKKHLSFLKNFKKIIIAGDPDQSIYTDALEIEEITDGLRVKNNCCHELSILYRLPQKVVEIADKILPDTQMIFADNGRRGDEGKLVTTRYEDMETEAKMVYELANDLAKPQRPSLIILPNHNDIFNFTKVLCNSWNVSPPPRPNRSKGPRDYTRFNQHLKDVGINLMFFGSNNGDLGAGKLHPKTFIMTYHSAKGLDFAQVFLPNLNSDMEFWRDREDISRRLFFVGLTRTSKDLYLSFNSRNPHSYLEKIIPITGIIEFKTSFKTDDPF